MSKVKQLEDSIQSLDGYKIGETHFKIGAKIHSTDFYYAKRLFQNSYYTARIALLLAIKIKDKLSDKQTPLTIVGYEMYSELLLGLIKKFLIDFGYNQVNHFVTLDTDEQIKHEPSNIVINSKVVIVVPIASTGSTSIKIENYINNLDKNIDILTPHFNVLLAFDENSDLYENFNNDDTKQNPIIKLSANWESPSNCKWCFNNDLLRPLFETDKSSLTPALIFDLPSAKTITENTLGIEFDKVDFKDAIIYRKTKRNNEHFLFSTNTEVLIKKNQNQIEAWLAEVKKELQQNLMLGPTDKIVIISPCHYSNATFINLLNDKLFNSSATIIHHQTDVDYLTNFKLLNKNYLNQPDTKIFFVDDSLISGRSFFNIYDLFRFTADYKKRLTGAIFLSNKSSPDIHERVLRATERVVYSFVNINLPLPPKVSDKKPLEHEIKRYNDLSKLVLSDVLIKTFSEKSKDLNGEKTEQIKATTESIEKKDQHFKMFKATHKAYEFLKFLGHKTDPDLHDFDFDDLLRRCGFDEKELEDKMAMMKVLSQYPFLLYLPIRKETFKWHKAWLNFKVDELQEKTKQGFKQTEFITYDDFRELKFLVRRAVFLGNYEVLSIDFFSLIGMFFEIINLPNGIHKLSKKRRTDLFEEISFESVSLTDYETDKLKKFHIYMMTQYVELIQKNGWCATKIIECLDEVESCFNTAQGKQFLRMLRIEAASVLIDFYALIYEKPSVKKEWEELYKFKTDVESDPKEKNKEIIIDEENKEILNFFKKNEDILTTNKFELSNKVLGLKDNADNWNVGFLNFLWIKQFLNTDNSKSKDNKSKVGDISLSDKTEAIFNKLKGLFVEKTKVGAFFVVTDGNDNPHLVYDQDSEGNRFLKKLDGEKHSVVLEFLKGTPDVQNIASKSIIEFKNIGNDLWEDTYSLENPAETTSFVSDCNWLLLIRISNSKSRLRKLDLMNTVENLSEETDQDSKYRTLGLMGFYAQESLYDDQLAKQLLMLLREDIGTFIEKHHKNDEFSALREAEATKRFAYLAGHGRQMLQRLSKEHRDIFGDVVGTMEKLQYLFATKLISPSGNSKVLKENSDKNLFDNVFLRSNVAKKDIDEIVKIGNQIYETNIIENEVEIDKIANFVGEDFSFSFNKQLLTLICFELIVNSKKNRFHFISGACPACTKVENDVVLNFVVDSGKLIITLMGTGPSVPSDIVKKINCGDDLKDDTEIAGLNLINKVLRILDNQNKISIKSQEKCRECGIHENTVRVELSPIN